MTPTESRVREVMRLALAMGDARAAAVMDFHSETRKYEFRASRAALESAVRALAEPPAELAACAKYLKDGETPAQRIERERRDANAVLTLLIREKERTKALEELLCSAHCIALRHGADTAWDTFAASINALGISAVTARTYKAQLPTPPAVKG